MTFGSILQTNAMETFARATVTTADRRKTTMKCPRCGMDQTRVTDSRQLRDGEEVSRRRECLVCGYRFTTHETVVGKWRRYQREW